MKIKEVVAAVVYGIIDIGSNTIRLAIYDIKGKQIEMLLKKKFMTGLAGYIKDDVMIEEGIVAACEAIHDFKRLLKNFNIDNIAAFATAALRNVKNSKEAVAEIERITGITVDLISGEEEAFLDFVGATQATVIQDGILIDIGGGSTELVIYQGDEIKSMVSLPIGSLNMYKNYVQNIFPIEEDESNIRQAVLDELEQIKAQVYGRQEYICGVGGTMRATVKLYNEIFDLEVDNVELSIDKLKEMVESLTFGRNEVGMPTNDNLDLILKIVPERIRTIMPGVIILITLADFFESDHLYISSSGVREGYIYAKIAK